MLNNVFTVDFGRRTADYVLRLDNLQDISDAADVFNLDMRIVTKVLGHPRHKHIHTPRNKKAVIFPDRFEEHVPLNDTIGVTEKHCKSLHSL